MFALKACAGAGNADVLAGESSADDITGDAIEGSDVLVNRDAWPVFVEDVAAERVDFTELDGSHSGSFESEAESADAAE
jgi:hypothetical protein